jgi:hypothetical protein
MIESRPGNLAAFFVVENQIGKAAEIVISPP